MALESTSKGQWSTADVGDLIWLFRRNHGAPVPPQRMSVNLSSKNKTATIRHMLHIVN